MLTSTPCVPVPAALEAKAFTARPTTILAQGYGVCLESGRPVLIVHLPDRLVGLVVKVSASRAEDPRFESRLRQDFWGVESYQ